MTQKKQNAFPYDDDDVKQQCSFTSFNFTAQYNKWLRQESGELHLPTQIIF